MAPALLAKAARDFDALSYAIAKHKVLVYSSCALSLWSRPMLSLDVAGYYVRGLLEGLRVLRIDVDHVLDACKLDRALLADPELRVPAEQLHALFQHAEQRYGKPGFSFELARRVPFGKLELIDCLVTGGPTVGASVECLAHHTQTCASGFGFSIEDYVHEREPGRRLLHHTSRLSEYNWMLLISRLRRATGPAFQPVLWLREKPSMPASEQLDTLGRFPLIAETDALFISDKQWNIANASRIGKADFAITLQNTLVAAMHRGDPSIGRVATRLGFTPRTLQRRLDQDDLTFQQVLEELRKELALHYLQSTQLSLAEITGLLAYSDVSAFVRAFQGWTGRTPSELRKSAQLTAANDQLGARP